MGITGLSTILKEIKCTERIALSRLAIDHLTRHRRPLRIAIDIAIWNYEIKCGRGGTNPGLRVFYQRLLRVLSLSIHPLFVFDGPYKPPFKRDKATVNYSDYDVDKPQKDLLDLFGFPWHVAPGEAEAECALLQRHDVVDAVLSEDFDSLMFGSKETFMNWSDKEMKGKGTKSHVDVYRQTKTEESGLDRHGMILVAMMSGGDYIPQGIPGCGQKISFEAAKAGFGRDLCSLDPDNSAAIDEWKVRLRHEWDTNESGYFTTKHKKLQIPEEFPDRTVLRYYTHPAISTLVEVQNLKKRLVWDQDPDILGLRGFVATNFDWNYKSGARHFIRGLSGPLLIHILRRRADTLHIYRGPEDAGNGLNDERSMLIGPNKTRVPRAENDGLQDLRVHFTPIEIIPLDMDTEEDNPQRLDGLSDWEELDEDANEVDNEQPVLFQKKPRKKAFFDVTQYQELWVFQALLEMGVPKLMDHWIQYGRPVDSILPNQPSKTKDGSVQQGAIEGFLKISKPQMSAKSSDVGKVVGRSVLVHSPSKLKSSRSTVFSGRTMIAAKSTKAKKSQVLGKSQTKLDFSRSPRRVLQDHTRFVDDSVLPFPATCTTPTLTSRKRSLSPPNTQLEQSEPRIEGLGSSQAPILLGSSPTQLPSTPKQRPQDPSELPTLACHRDQNDLSASQRDFTTTLSSSPLMDLHMILTANRPKR